MRMAGRGCILNGKPMSYVAPFLLEGLGSCRGTREECSCLFFLAPAPRPGLAFTIGSLGEHLLSEPCRGQEVRAGGRGVVVLLSTREERLVVKELAWCLRDLGSVLSSATAFLCGLGHVIYLP